MGLASRKSHNDDLRRRGIEPEPGPYAGVKRWKRYHSRIPPREITEKTKRRIREK